MAEALRSLANLVEDVASRTDTDHVLREICGHYALERCTLAQRDLHYAGVRFMSWSRLLLFAVYRATLRTSDSDAACSLPTSALIAGLSFILTVDESQCMPDEPEVDWKTWKSYTFLLGLRLLRGTLADDTYTASPQQLQMLMARLSQSCPSDGDPRDVNDVSWLCHELLHRGHQRAQRIEGPVATARSSRGGHNTGPDARNSDQFHLPDNNIDWTDHYWRIFDRVSDTEAKFFASISHDQSTRCHGYLSDTLLGPFGALDPPIFEHWRSSLARTLVIPGKAFHEPHQIRNLIDEKYHLELGLYSTLRSNSNTNQLEPGGTARGLCDFLSTRASALENAGGSIHRALDDIAEKAREWHRHNRQDHGIVTERRDEGDAIYVLSCPRLHLTSKEGLVEYLGNVDTNSLQKLQNGATYVHWAQSKCPSCNYGCHSARLVEPLQGILQHANTIESERLKVKGRTDSLLQITSEAPIADIRVSSDTAPSIGSTGPRSSLDRQSSRQPSIRTASSHSNGFFKDPEKLKFAFATSGVNLILWKPTHGCFATLDMYGSSDSYWEVPADSSSDIRLVAGGNAVFCALVKDNDKTYALHVFTQDHSEPRSSSKIELPAPAKPLAMAVSPDDSSIAIGFGNVVVTCNANVTSCPSKHPLTSEEVWDQVINFSRDSSRIVVAYRYGTKGHVYCSTWKTSGSTKAATHAWVGSWRKGEVGDFGLRSVFYDDVKQRPALAIYMSHLSIQSQCLIGGSMSQCAAHSDDAFLVISDKNTKRRHEVLKLSTNNATEETWLNLQSFRGKKIKFTQKEELPIIATARADKTVVFWVSGDNMNLVYIQKRQSHGHTHEYKHEHKVINERFLSIPVTHGG